MRAHEFFPQSEKKLFERKGVTFHTTEYKYLYHLTDHHGFAYTVDQNALKGLRQHYVSTTYDAAKNGVYGYSHYDFKFVMDGKRLVETYGGFNYDHHIMVGDRRRAESLDEREIGIDTRSIEPFTDYLVGVVLLFPMFSQKAIQWLLYDNTGSKGFFGPETSTAPRTIETLHKVMVEWRKPIWMYTENGQRKLTEQEQEFLKDVLAIHTKGGDFDEGMRELTLKYPIKDHWNKDLDRTTVIRRQHSDKLVDMLNAYYQNRKFIDVDPNVPRRLMAKVMEILGLGNNISTVIMGAIEDAGLFHQSTAAVDWGIIIKSLMSGDVEEALDDIKYLQKNNSHLRKHFDDDPEGSKYATHAGTRF